jgi:hypothetical protein
MAIYMYFNYCLKMKKVTLGKSIYEKAHKDKIQK